MVQVSISDILFATYFAILFYIAYIIIQFLQVSYMLTYFLGQNFSNDHFFLNFFLPRFLLISDMKDFLVAQ